MREAYHVLNRPVLTEKAAALEGSQNTYVFKVREDATKDEVRLAVESLFGVKVEDVRTLRQRGKYKRYGRFVALRSHWKKAFVRLADGQSLNFFEA